MRELPQLLAEDITAIDGALAALLVKTDATAVLMLDPAGFIITRKGELGEIELSTLGALTANAYAATQAIAGLFNEPDVTSLLQEGEANSLLIQKIDDTALLLIVFPESTNAGAVKHFANSAIHALDTQLGTARKRAPGARLDLSALNLADPSGVFSSGAA